MRCSTKGTPRKGIEKNQEIILFWDTCTPETMLITGCTAAVVTWSDQAVSFIQQELYAKHRRLPHWPTTAVILQATTFAF